MTKTQRSHTQALILMPVASQWNVTIQIEETEAWFIKLHPLEASSLRQKMLFQLSLFTFNIYRTLPYHSPVIFHNESLSTYSASEQCSSLVIMNRLHCEGYLSTLGIKYFNIWMKSLSCNQSRLWGMLIHIRNVTPDHTLFLWTLVNCKNAFRLSMIVLTSSFSINRKNQSNFFLQRSGKAPGVYLFNPLRHTLIAFFCQCF